MSEARTGALLLEKDESHLQGDLFQDLTWTHLLHVVKKALQGSSLICLIEDDEGACNNIKVQCSAITGPRSLVPASICGDFVYLIGHTEEVYRADMAQGTAWARKERRNL